MKTDAIVYTSNTGFTFRYAEMLSAKTGLPFYELRESKSKLPKGANVIYMGWLMAGSVTGYKPAAKRFNVRAVCGVCLGDTGSQTDTVIKLNKIPDGVAVFTVQGGYNSQKVKGVYKFMMNALAKALSGKPNRTADENAMLELILNGGDFVREENLAQFLAWFETNCQN